MENDAIFTELIAEVTGEVQNIKLPVLKQSNFRKVFFEALNNER